MAVDAGSMREKKVLGRKRHIVTDTIGSLLVLRVHPANIRNNHRAAPLLKRPATRSAGCGISSPIASTAATSRSTRSPSWARDD